MMLSSSAFQVTRPAPCFHIMNPDAPKGIRLDESIFGFGECIRGARV